MKRHGYLKKCRQKRERNGETKLENGCEKSGEVEGGERENERSRGMCVGERMAR